MEDQLTPRRLLVAFAAALAVGFASHEIWFDELQAWSIARDSGSLAELVDNRAYEGHPMLWHLILWVLSRVTRDPWILQVFQAATALGVAALIVHRAPFRPWVRAGLVLGYFPVYEYGVIARPYALTVLLVLGACSLMDRRPRPLLAIAALLALAAQLTAFAVIVVSAVALAVGVDELVGHRHRPRSWWAAVAAAALVTVAIAASVAQIRPPADAPFGGGLDTPESARFDQPFAVVTPALLPVRPPGPDFWFDYHLLRPWGGLLGLPLVALAAVALVRRPGPLAVWLSGSAVIVGLAAFRFAGSLRHHGHLALILLAACWMWHSAQSWPVTHRWRTAARSSVVRLHGATTRALGPAVGVLLAVHVLAAGLALWSAVRHPFSATSAAAARLERAGLAEAPWIGYSDLIPIAIATSLDRPVMLASRGDERTFVVWDSQQRRLEGEELVAEALAYAAAQGRAVVLISTIDLDHGGRFRELGRMPEESLGESVTLYEVPPPIDSSDGRRAPDGGRDGEGGVDRP